MVCEKCQAKLTPVAAPDKWRGPTSGAARTSHARVHTLALTHTRTAAAPFAAKCERCRGSIHLKGAKLCQSCAYKSGECAMCGVKVLDTRAYRMSSV